jgi:hypothetical protein
VRGCCLTGWIAAVSGGQVVRSERQKAKAKDKGKRQETR